MKKIYTLFVALIIMGCLMAQSPGKINYQGVVRDADFSPLVEQAVTFRFTIFQPPKGISYEEVQNTTTNKYGMVILTIGEGDPVAFAEIDWSASDYNLIVECDPTGGTNYTIVEERPINSVPYALHANTASRTTGDSIWKKSTDDIYFDEGKVGIGGDNPTSRLSIFNEPLGLLLDDRIDWLRLEGKSGGNSDNIYLFHRRHMDGSNWNSSEIRIQKQVDSSPMHYISFMGLPGNISRLEFGYSTIPYMSIDRYGKVGIGTTTPTKPLEVVGDIKMGNDLTLWQSAKAVTIRQDENNTWIGNIADFVGNGAADNGRLFLIGQDGVYFRYGLGSGAGTVGMLLNSVGNVCVGASSPSSRLQVEGGTTWPDEEPLFSVKNKDGIPVFAVFNNGVRILVEDDQAKGPKGGFSIGGFDRTKDYAGTYDFMRITPDTIRFLINNDASKGPKGGFSIGGFDRNKGLVDDFMKLTPDNSSSGKYNTFVGYKSGYNNTGENNTFIGSEAGYSNTSGSYNNFIGLNAGKANISGSSNCFLGNGAGLNNQTGYGNVFIGNGSGANSTMGFNNVFIGTNSGLYSTVGDYNVIIGAHWAGTIKPDWSKNIMIGAQAGMYETDSCKLYIDGSLTGGHFWSSLIYGHYGTGTKYLRINGDLQYTGTLSHVSDIKLKTNLISIENVLSKIKRISGYYFDWNNEAKENLIVVDKRQIGVIAQELEVEFPELVSENEEGYKMVDYANLTPVLLQAIKEQQKQIEGLRSRNDEIDDLKAQIEELRMVVGTLMEK